MKIPARMLGHTLKRTLQRTVRAAGVVGFSCLALTRCSQDSVAPPPLLNAENGFWELTLNHVAITMSTVAPYDTIRLVPTPRNANGDPLANAENAVTLYRVTDPTNENLTVSADGIIHAVHASSENLVTVTTTLGGVARADTITVNITNVSPPPEFASIDFRVTNDTLYTASDYFTYIPPTLSATALDAGGDSIPGVTFALWSANPKIASVFSAFKTVYNSGSQLQEFGRVMMYAASTVYGVTRTDSLAIFVTLPTYAQVNVRFTTPSSSTAPVADFNPSSVTITAGGSVEWDYAGNLLPPVSNPLVDVVFDDSTAAVTSTRANAVYCDPTGKWNIAPFAVDATQPCSNTIKVRAFPRAGTYHYHSTLYETSGTIIVIP